MLLLFGSEVLEFFTVEVVHSISVDTRINQKLPISLDITFPHLRCDEISVDTVDSAGVNQVNVQGTLEKFPLNSKSESAQDSVQTGGCSSCYAAADDTHTCCNTCAALKEAYQARGLSYHDILHTAEQCLTYVGCRVQGTVIVNKVSGNVHVALGKSIIRDGRHVHEFNVNDVTDGFNTSHEIHSIRFGDFVQGTWSPLDGVGKIVKHGAYMFHYYFKLVPTVYVSRSGEEVYTHQYSVTDAARNVPVRNGELTGLPGVFLVYDFSPFLMRKVEKTRPWSYIFTTICAIIGGVFSIASLAEMLAHFVMHWLSGAR